MPGPYTRAQLVTMVGEELQDTAGVYFTSAKIQEFLNKAMAEWCERTRARRATVSTDVTAEQAQVDLSAISPAILEIQRVALPPSSGSEDEYELTYTTMEEIERVDRNWRTTRGQPTRYMRWGDGHLSLRLYPEPDTSFAEFIRGGGAVWWDSLYGMAGDFTVYTPGAWEALYGSIAGIRYGGLRVDYVAAATAFTAGSTGDSETPLGVSDIPSEYHEALAHYACARCLLMETSVKQAERAASVYMPLWEKAIGAASRQTKTVFQGRPTRTQRGGFV